MRELVILAALVSALHAASLPTDTDVQYECQEDQDNIATLEAESFINDHHRHGYKFKFVSLDSRSAEEKTDPCEVVLGITLEETECHIVNPKPLDQCNTRMETQTKVTAKCNVTVSSVEGKAAVKRYICDTEPASHQILVTKCPDCPSLLPLHDPKALESVKTALQKFNKESDHKSYFKLMEVGRISTQWMFSGQSFFAQFAIMETNCTNKEAPQNEESCKALCGDQAQYGFCKSTKVGNEEPIVECEIYEAQNETHPMKHPAQSRRDCKFHGPPPGHRPGHEGHDHKDKFPGHRGRPEHTGHDHKDKTPDQRGRPEHTGHDHKDKTPDQRGRPEHAGHDHKDKKHDHRGHPEHPHLCPKGPSGVPESAPEGRHEFPCHGFVKIPPSIYPICPFPPPRLCRGPPDFIRPRPPPQ
ncbi:alpha-2-HS-glycoprotein 1 isoform X2 [Sinocyclocheilus anshuiensis]|uniref:Alpha-2-HS-glycoprotein-like n=1 Tax=Sinocyclocheilus anshuiensis TaxID=1608454 RepID=A0A671KSG7_9TELE|nr:PREDICTED: alpha-2-HS-glycoprotein-like isoform X1 [Sinocyclocheilus anshuiensis]XP_016308536.1 PREDICTED: alpha-2-HS-glycoprotein-like isoform X2 [Sinocyclocheilus anshuiensis]